MHEAMLFVHVGAASVWVGATIGLAIGLLPQALSKRDPEIVLGFERVYERIGLPAMAVQVATGLWLAWRVGPETGRSLCRNLSMLHLLIDRTAKRRFMLAPMQTTRVSDDEQLLIGVFAEVQRDNWPLAVTYLEDFLRQDCTERAFDPVSAIVAMLGGAGHRFTTQPEVVLQDGGVSHRPGCPARDAATTH